LLPRLARLATELWRYRRSVMARMIGCDPSQGPADYAGASRLIEAFFGLEPETGRSVAKGGRDE